MPFAPRASAAAAPASLPESAVALRPYADGGTQVAGNVVQVVASHGAELRDLCHGHVSLEGVFIHLTGRWLR